jgi:hypothetical protein
VATAAEDRLNIRHNAHVVFGSQRLPTQIAFDDPLADVRFAPESGQIADVSVGPSRARTGREQSQQPA